MRLQPSWFEAVRSLSRVWWVSGLISRRAREVEPAACRRCLAGRAPFVHRRLARFGCRAAARGSGWPVVGCRLARSTGDEVACGIDSPSDVRVLLPDCGGVWGPRPGASCGMPPSDVNATGAIHVHHCRYLVCATGLRHLPLQRDLHVVYGLRFPGDKTSREPNTASRCELRHSVCSTHCVWGQAGGRGRGTRRRERRLTGCVPAMGAGNGEQGRRMARLRLTMPPGRQHESSTGPLLYSRGSD